jgi:hypothetical protein
MKKATIYLYYLVLFAGVILISSCSGEKPNVALLATVTSPSMGG